ncbi:hypothetical protein ACIOHC_36190 [Streptomyces sp. NPDC088252]|uniref:hypothetical protein n=1 Tax=Streptomyces sp. NPDC088252 TaxID=3365845 RepID=UPI00380A2880
MRANIWTIDALASTSEEELSNIRGLGAGGIRLIRERLAALHGERRDEMNASCGSNRHCVEHGWCHRCDPELAELGSRLNVKLDEYGLSTELRGRLYTELMQMVHEWDSDWSRAAAPSNPPENMGELARLQLMRLGQKVAANEAKRVEVNPEPLKGVAVSAGVTGPEQKFLFARRWRGERLVAASIHRDGCKRAPEDGHVLRDSSNWTVEKIPRDQVNQSVFWVADQHVRAWVWCPTCGGWRVS